MKTLNACLIAAAALGGAILVPAVAGAANSWVLPSTTVLSGSNAWVSVDAATSDELYYPNLRPLPLASIQVLDPDGQVVAPQNAVAGKFRAAFDVQVTKPGTWKITSFTTAIMASWTENGAVKRFRGTGEDFAKQTTGADLKTVRTLSRNETFFTRDTPTTTVFKTTGQGLEMEPITHPSDVVAGEPARFRLLLDGKPAAGLEVLFKRGGDRWLLKPVEVLARTDAEGAVQVTLPQGGLWWMNATWRTGDSGRPASPAGPPAAPPAPGAGPPPPQPLAGDGYIASYSAVIEALLP